MTERGPMSSPLFKREDGIAHWANGPVALVIIIFDVVVVVVVVVKIPSFFKISQ